MLINAPLISPKIQHANKRTFDFQNPEILGRQRAIALEGKGLMINVELSDGNGDLVQAKLSN